MEIHPQFQLNGHTFNEEELREVAYSWVKEGKPFEVAAGDFLLDWLDPSDSLTVRTSGSTGIPKSIRLRKKHMVNSALATGHYFQLKAGDSVLHCLSTEFIAGKMMLVRAMVLGLHINVVEPSSTPLLASQKSYDFCAMVPLQVHNSLSQLSAIKKLIVGGAPISDILRQKLMAYRTKIFETYGMTETITHIAVKRISGQPSNVFETLSNITVKTDNRDCLIIDAPKIADEQIITNDLVELISKNEFRWLGRYDNVINSGGVKLIPEQIEKKLSPIIESRFFVIGIPDQELGEKLVLFVEGEDNEETINKKIQELKTLDRFEIPKYIFYVKKFDETSTGKVQRQKVKAKFLKS